MKVALLTDCYLPRLGGIEVQTHDLAAQLRSRGHEVEVFTATVGERGERQGFVEDVDGVPVHRMAIRLPWELPVNPFAPPQVRQRLQAGGFDVAHVQMGVVSPFATDMAGVALGLGLPTAITWHCLMERSRPLFRVLGHARRWGASGAALSAVSGVAAASVQQVVGGASEVRVFPNGIDASRWSPPPAAPPAGAGGAASPIDAPGEAPIEVVAAMRFAARKRPMAVLEVAARARDLVAASTGSGPRMHLTLFGEGPERGRLERFATRHDMTDWVSMPGRVGRDQLRERYWDSDIYLTPARLEAFGIAALEARTAGLPVVARRDTGVGDFVVDGVNGLLGTDDAALARALARLLTDPELRAGITATNRSMPPEQDWPAVAALAEAEYRRAGAS
ncbi:glycosyltransferase involved in cell wall biosynthesis [Phycicoccus badiiscoriae]|uniref:D-inositol 3-phosphate glycosyltransferase n=1 Tax=Pedococcus badiiscoriae TaxID=642776 RepID=A0A852WE13_9MICO|nr:glycosyltransferase involved in cell wall biosynthesis [Pedococcus badiiscoriae]